MALYLHLGASGSGKTYNLIKMIAEEAAENFDRNFLLVVPEQFTLQTQRDMIAAAKNGGIMNIDVLSFPRMAHRIFEELGVKTPVMLEDTGKTMIVKKVALDCRDKLGIYAGKVHRQGFIGEMKSVIAEFYQYGIGEDELEEMMNMAEGRPGLRAKLQDISVIYSGFRDFISGRFIMNEELLELFIEKAPASKVLKGAAVMFDGFTGFTVMQLKVIECLMQLGCDIHVTLTMDPRDAERSADEDNLFALSRKTMDKLIMIADRTGTDVRSDICEKKVPVRFRNSPELAALEHNIFRRGVTPFSPVDGSYRAVIPVSCENSAAEVTFCINEIKRLVSNPAAGYRYCDTAIVVGDVSSYGRIVDREMTAAGIPFFIDSKKNILGTAPVEMLRAVLEITESDFSYESVFRFLKAGLAGFDGDSISALENYCLARAIRGQRMWGRNWEGAYKTRYKVDIDAINKTRQAVYAMLAEPVKKLKSASATVGERVSVLRGILEGCGVEEKLEEAAEAKRNATGYADRLAALEYSQLYGILEQVFERITLLLGNDVISFREFTEILNTGFSEAKLALIPQGGDSVLVGDIERTRLNSVKALFIIGANEGLIPASSGETGLLSDADRSIFAEHDIELSPTKREAVYLNEFYLYLNLTKPSDRLYLSYHRMTADKKAGRPSYLYGKLKRVFPKAEIKHLYAHDDVMLVGCDSGKMTAAKLMSGRRPEMLTDAERTLLCELMTRDRGLFDKLTGAAFFERIPAGITPANAAKLYGRMLTGSVTMLEKYASCEFAHFLNYGLKLEERPEYALGSLEVGNIYHKALECYCKALKEADIKWHDTTAEMRGSFETNALDAAFADYGDILADSSRNEYIRTRVERILSRTVEILDAQVKAGDFEPEYFEKTFRHTGEFMALEGKIDRMDICGREGHRVLRVIDYKSGHKDFDLQQLFHGLQIQLAVYMTEGMKDVREQYGDTEFAGMYYYNIDDPFISADKENVTYDEAVRKALRLKGPSAEEPLLLRTNDSGLADESGKLNAGYTSSVINAAVTVKGAMSSKAQVYENGHFEKIGKYVEHIIKENCSRILEGKTEINPYEYGQNNACGFCPYGAVCGFERRLGDRYRRVMKMSDDDVLMNISEVIDG